MKHYCGIMQIEENGFLLFLILSVRVHGDDGGEMAVKIIMYNTSF